MRGLIKAVVLGALALAMALFPSGQGDAGRPVGKLEVRITDHRAGIADFKWLEVTVAGLAIHRKGEGRRKGWVEVVSDAAAVDIVPLKNGLWQLLGRASAPTGDYDAVRVRFARAEGELLTGARPKVRTGDTAVQLDFIVGPDGNPPVVLDLYAEDLTDHEPQHYLVKVKAVRLGE